MKRKFGSAKGFRRELWEYRWELVKERVLMADCVKICVVTGDI
ncbi:hypothetical protein PM8797T_12608 [Gimesia maris DSM 8797]|jgi:hypothetical protein|nr:hypothetical protein PM8797T_12608 [Gimesia maris DSM 8797]